VIDQKAPDADGFDESLRLAVDFVARWKGRNNRIIPIIGAHSVYTVKPEQLKEVRRQALELNVPVSIHLSEISFEVEFTTENYGKTPVHHLESLDFFSGPTIGAHLVWPTESEIPILAQRRVGAIHNPTSNMKISSGISPVTEMLAQGVPLGLGTDGAASNNDLDMWEEMRLAAFLQKVGTMDPEALPAITVLNMATRGGAAAIGLSDEIGSLTVGRRADMIQVSLTDVHFVPTYDVISHLVYVADEQDVSTVVVDGKVLMRDGKILTLDTDRVRKESVDLAARIQAALEPEQAAD
jgi:5-methylthioadenosine/S-adenosylhomocysteine deaminase